MTKEEIDFYSGKDEIEITDEMIEELIKAGKLREAEVFKEMRSDGAKYNTKRNSFVWDAETI